MTDAEARASDDALAVARMESLGRRGLTVSVVCGPSGPHAFRWSVDVLSANREGFAMPFAADSFAQAVIIAEHEALMRGWLT